MFNWLTAALCNLVWEGETPLLIKNILFFCLEKSELTGDTPSFLLMTVFYVQLVVLLQASFPQGWQVRVDMLV